MTTKPTRVNTSESPRLSLRKFVETWSETNLAEDLKAPEFQARLRDSRADFRTVTLGIASDTDSLDQHLRTREESLIGKGCELIDVIREIEPDSRLPIRSCRIATEPISQTMQRLMPEARPQEWYDFVKQEAQARERAARIVQGYLDSMHEDLMCNERMARLYDGRPMSKDFFVGGLSHGPGVWLSGEKLDAVIKGIAEGLKQTTRNFGAISLDTRSGEVDWQAVALAAKQVVQIKSGAAKMAVGRNLPPTPYFPCSYHAGGLNAISIGVAAPGAIKLAIEAASDDAVEWVVAGEQSRVLRLAHALGNKIVSRMPGTRFAGVDPSQAPVFSDEFPGRNSVGAAVEAISHREFGQPGTKHAFSRFMAGIKAGARLSGAPLVGFEGEFLPVSEDDVLAKRVEQGFLSYQCLLDLCHVCASGIDMLILNRETNTDLIEKIYADVVTTASIKSKPLACRLIVPEANAPINKDNYVELGGLLGAGPEMDIEIDGAGRTNKLRRSR